LNSLQRFPYSNTTSIFKELKNSYNNPTLKPIAMNSRSTSSRKRYKQSIQPNSLKVFKSLSIIHSSLESTLKNLYRISKNRDLLSIISKLSKKIIKETWNSIAGK